MFAELYAIYKGLLLAKDLSYINLVCYFNSLHCVNLIQGPSMKFHIYAVLIQEIKELLEQMNVTVCLTLREGNQCADFMAKLGASSNIEFLLHASPPDYLLHLLKFDAAGTFFSNV
jgi:ribonuclease HI